MGSGCQNQSPWGFGGIEHRHSESECRYGS
jgi:hypothetical protein